jgi:hypothetical protein
VALFSAYVRWRPDRRRPSSSADNNVRSAPDGC